MKTPPLTCAALAAFLVGASELVAQGGLRHDFMVGPEFLVFESNRLNEPAAAGRASGSLLWTTQPGRRFVFSAEPRAGLRVLSFTDETTTEFVGEMEAALLSAPPGQPVRWRLDLEGKLRTLSDRPSLPAYLEPGRYETWAGGRAAIPLVAQFDLELRGNAGLVRYDPKAWQVLDRDGIVGSLGLSHALGPGFARVSVGTTGYYFQGAGRGREDHRWELNVDWSASETLFFQVEGGVAWNRSNLNDFAYRSLRGALLLSAPLGRGSTQLYGAFASKVYTKPTPRGDALVAPSEKDTGSFVVIQYTRSIGDHTTVHLRGEWSRSETGFRNQYFQRLGFGAMISWRGPLR